MNEGRGQRPVAVSAGYVVGAELGRLDVLDEQPKRGSVAHDARAQDRAMFVLVAGEEMLHDPLVDPGSYQDVATPSTHGSSSRKCSTFKNLATAVCG